MAYLGTQPNDVKKNTGLYTPSEILQLEKDGSWGGSLELIERQTHTGDVNFIDFTDIKEDIFDVHYLTYNNLKVGSNNVSFGIQLYESGVLETASVYHYAYQKIATNGTQYLGSTVSVFMFLDFSATGGGVGKPENAEVYLYNLGNSSQKSYMMSHGAGIDAFAGAGTVPKTNFNGSVLPQLSTVDGFRIVCSGAQNFTDFDVTLYGMKQK
jgi:hypothetical protein